MRVGIGYDIHALVAGRPLILGGIRVDYPKGLQGHSDGDVLFHAIIDALLGAAGLGDIGDYFSDQDAKFAGADSRLFVKKVTEILKRRRFKIGHIDSVLVAEAPKLAGVKDSIRRSVAKAFHIPLSSVSVKAKTNEGFGAVGKKQAIACYAVASLKEVR